jgi:hypothetical protein
MSPQANIFRNMTESQFPADTYDAGGDLTCFTVERIDENAVRTVDLLMCGNGRWGGLGNNIYSSAQGNPLRAKSVSGLLECESSYN